MYAEECPAVFVLSLGWGIPHPSTALAQNWSPALFFSVCACACCCANQAAMTSPLLLLAEPGVFSSWIGWTLGSTLKKVCARKALGVLLSSGSRMRA